MAITTLAHAKNGAGAYPGPGRFSITSCAPLLRDSLVGQGGSDAFGKFHVQRLQGVG